jgi:imidazolonepropionase
LQPGGRYKADLILHNIGSVATVTGFSDSPAIHLTDESLGLLSTPQLCIASSAGRICYIGRKSDLNDLVDTGCAEEVDCRQKLVLPGFVDSHNHTIFAGTREDELVLKISGLSYLEILARGGGINRVTGLTRSASDDELLIQTRRKLDRMIANGTTTFEAKTGYALSLKDEIRLLEVLSRLRAEGYDIEPTLLSAHVVPSEYLGRSDDYIEDVVLPSIDIASERKLARFCDVFVQEGIFDLSQSERILRHASERGLALKVHADEFSDENAAALAARMKVTTADHLLMASKENLSALARNGVISVLLPTTALVSFIGKYADANYIAAQGGAIALASDFSQNSWIESMQFVIALACYGMRMTPAQAIVASTINGAHAVLRAKDVGSVELGKKADLLLSEHSNIAAIPYRMAANSIAKIFKEGRLIRDNER